MSALDAGDIVPATTVGPARDASGAVVLGRVLTRFEQRADVLEQLRAALVAARGRPAEIRARVLWPDAEPTVLEAPVTWETVNGARVPMLGGLVEYLETGGEIVADEARTLRELTEDIGALHERGMI